MKTLTVLTFSVCAMAWAQAPPAAPAEGGQDPVVARIGDKPMTGSEAMAILKANPPEAQQNLLKDPKAFVEKLALMRTLSDMAVKAKLDQQSPIKEELELVRIQRLAQAQVTAKIDSIPVTIDEQKKFYEANPDRFTQAKVKVLFVSFRANPTPQTDPAAKKILSQAEAKAKIEKLLADIRGGADFVKLVKENSDDKESVARDGDFGQPIRKSDNLPDDIRKAIFSLKAGQVCEPVSVSSGFYLFRLEELTTQPFNDVSNDIFQEIRLNRFNEWLDKTTKALDVKIENPDFFTRAAAATGK